MGTIHFVGGEKGGVGKSFTARLLAQYFIDKDMPFHGFDSDQSNASFKRFYEDFTDSVNTSAFSSLDKIIDVAEQKTDSNFIIDLAAQTAKNLDKWIEESDIFSLLKELGFSVFVWHVMDDGADSLHLLGETVAKAEGQDVNLVVVENHGRGEDFELAEQSDIFHKAVELGASVLSMSRLDPALIKKVDFSNASFWAAANNREVMSLVERNRVKTWLNKNYDQLQVILARAETQVEEEPEAEVHEHHQENHEHNGYQHEEAQQQQGESCFNYLKHAKFTQYH